MTAQIARVGDSAAGICTGHHSPVSWTGFIETGSTGTAGGQGIARVGDTGSMSCGHVFTITTGSSVGNCNGLAIALVGSTVVSSGGGGGTITSGWEFGTA